MEHLSTSLSTTDEYKKLRLHIYRYESGKLSDQDKVEMGFEDISSPQKW